MRELLIRELMEIYPYPRRWFESQPTSALVAMSCKKRKKRNLTNESYEKTSDNRKYENGEFFVLTESGWEVEIR